MPPSVSMLPTRPGPRRRLEVGLNKETPEVYVCAQTGVGNVQISVYSIKFSCLTAAEERGPWYHQVSESSQQNNIPGLMTLSRRQVQQEENKDIQRRKALAQDHHQRIKQTTPRITTTKPRPSHVVFSQISV